MTDLTISAIVTHAFPRLDPETPIRRAAATMIEAAVASAPVVAEDGQIAGILSQKDCFRSALNASYYREWKGSVADHMTKDVISVVEDDGLFDVAERFLNLKYRAFPVLDGTRVTGMVHRSDVLKALLDLG